MKKILALLLCTAMLLSAAACAGKNDTPVNPDSDVIETDEPDTDEPDTDEPETDEPETDDPGYEPATVSAQDIPGYAVDGVNGTGTKLMTQLFKDDENIFISPLSISLDFGILYTGAAGKTKADMAAYFGYAEDFGAHITDMHNITEYLIKGHEGASFHVADSLWINDLIAGLVKDSFLSVWEQEKAEINVEDFSDPDLPDRINGWVNENTRGMIPEVLKEVSPDMLMYLINAIYFEGKWYVPFEGGEFNEDQVFHTPGGDIKTDFMSREGSFRYYDDDKVQCVQIPYSDGMTSMYIIMPREDADCKEIIGDLPGYVKSTNDASFSEVFLKMPKLKLTYSCAQELIDAMTKGGLEIIFTDDADFSEMAETAVKVSLVIHKTALDVDEDGTKAAAVTVIGVKETMAIEGEEDKPINMIVDRPYYLVIADDDTGLVIFEGYIQDPAKK